MTDESYRYLEIVPTLFHFPQQRLQVRAELERPGEFLDSRHPLPDLDIDLVPVPEPAGPGDVRRDDEAEGVAPPPDFGKHGELYVG